MNSEIHEIASRFSLEVSSIQQHLAFLQEKHVVDVYEVERLNRYLGSQGLPLLPERAHLGLPPHHLTHEEILDLVTPAREACTAIRRVIAGIDSRIDLVSNHIEQNGDDVEVPEFSELIECVGGHLEDDSSDADLDLVIEHALREVMEVCDELDDDEWNDDSFHILSQDRKRDVLRTAAHYAMYRRLADRVSDLHDVIERLEEIQLIASATDSTAVSGLNRLGFIALTAAFDAAVFDLVRAALRFDFFSLTGVLGKSQYRLDQISDAGSWDEFRDQIIEQELKKLYAKQLLRLLANEWKVACVPDNVKFARLLEIMNRRNVHLHNRGVVDHEYCAGENLDGLQVGDLAAIDDEYWHSSKEICLHCVHQIAAWANSSVKSPGTA